MFQDVVKRLIKCSHMFSDVQGHSQMLSLCSQKDFLKMFSGCSQDVLRMYSRCSRDLLLILLCVYVCPYVCVRVGVCMSVCMHACI